MHAQTANIKSRLIVVDKSSFDSTIDIIKRHENLNPFIIIDKTGTRAIARQKGIKKVESKFLFSLTAIFMHATSF